MYSPQIARTILHKLHEREWNPYLSTHILHDGRDQVIRQGPAQKLEVHGRYVLLPRIWNSRDPEEVMDAVERLAVRLKREMPTITFGNGQYVICGFTLWPHAVKTHTPEGLVIPYELFLSGLETLVRGA